MSIIGYKLDLSKPIMVKNKEGENVELYKELELEIKDVDPCVIYGSTIAWHIHQIMKEASKEEDIRFLEIDYSKCKEYKHDEEIYKIAMKISKVIYKNRYYVKNNSEEKELIIVICSSKLPPLILNGFKDIKKKNINHKND